MNPEIKPVLIIVAATIVIIVAGLGLTKGGPAKAPEITIDQSALVSSTTPILGVKNAKVSIVEFADFACPACAALHPNLKTALASYGENVSLSLRLLPIHGKESIDSARAAYAAGEQGKFFEMGDILYSKQSEWTNKPGKRDLFLGYATTLGLNIAQFTDDYDSDELKKIVEEIIATDNRDAMKMNVRSTPTLIINGKTTAIGVKSVDALKALIDAELASTNPATNANIETNTGATSTTQTTPVTTKFAPTPVN